MRELRGRAAAIGVASVVLAITATGVAVASTQGGDAKSRTRITVCVGAKLNHLRLVPNSTTRCGAGETLLSWRTKGDKGAAGADGARGARGAAGANGKDGANGPAGADGLDGLDGQDGASAYDIAAAYGFPGTEADWLSSLHGADGRNGVDGTDGVDGLAGADGKDGTDGTNGVNGANGANGTNGANGANGADGKSAYEVAVANGFVGTQSAWLASLRGAAGATGATGATGPTGPAGPAGPAGPQGLPGAGLTPTSYYDQIQRLPASADGYSVDVSCKGGDLPVAPLWQTASGQSLVSVSMPTATGWHFKFAGPTFDTEEIGVRCLDL